MFSLSRKSLGQNKERMIQCASVRKKGSTDQCTANALKNHNLCGRHARCKVPVLWTVANASKETSVCKIQALVRGWLLRKRLELGGPGILCRKNLANNEELMTGDENIHPFDYFAYEEDGRIWWFSFNTIWRWCAQKESPDNPYTRNRIPTDVRKRIHAGWAYRQRHRIPLPEESNIFGERLRTRWTILSHIFEDYGYGDIPVNMFMRMTAAEFSYMFTLLHTDIRATVSDKEMWKQTAVRFCNRAIMTARSLSTPHYIMQSVYTLMLIMMKPKDPHAVAFMVLSAIHRC